MDNQGNSEQIGFRLPSSMVFEVKNHMKELGFVRISDYIRCAIEEKLTTRQEVSKNSSQHIRNLPEDVFKEQLRAAIYDPKIQEIIQNICIQCIEKSQIDKDAKTLALIKEMIKR